MLSTKPSSPSQSNARISSSLASQYEPACYPLTTADSKSSRISLAFPISVIGRQMMPYALLQ